MTVLDQVAAVAQSYGIPDWIWKPIMQLESGGNPAARSVTQFEDSRGLFQINTYAHPQYDASKLYDPAYNATIAFRDFIGPAYAQVQGRSDLTVGDKAAYTWKNGIRPAWNDTKNQQIRQQAEAVSMGSSSGNFLGVSSVGDFFKGLFGLPTSTPSTGPQSVPSQGYKNLVDTIKKDPLTWLADHGISAILFTVGIVLLIMTLKSMFLGGETVVVKEG